MQIVEDKLQSCTPRRRMFKPLNLPSLCPSAFSQSSLSAVASYITRLLELSLLVFSLSACSLYAPAVQPKYLL